MRHAPTTPLALLSLLLGTTFSGASAIAQDRSTAAIPRDAGPGIHFGSTRGLDRSLGIDPVTGTELGAMAQEDPDYSVPGLFSTRHGEYLQRAYGYRPSVRATYGRQAASELTNEGGDFDFDEFRLDTEFWVPVDPDTFLILGGNFGARRFQFDRVGDATTAFGPQAINDESLFEVSAKLGLGTFLDDDLLVTAQFEPGLYSDLDGTMKSEDWQFFGRGLVTWRASESVFLKGGVVVDRTFKEANLFPTVGVSWIFAEGWRLDVMVPQHVQIQWTPSAAWVFTTGLMLQGDRYEMRNGGVDRAVHTQELRLFVDGVYRMTDSFGVRGRFGGTLAGNYDIDIPGGNDFDGTVEPAVFFELGIDIGF